MTIEEQQVIVARARRARAEAVSALALGAARTLWTQGLRLRRLWAMVRTRSELHSLSDHMLRDIGVRRDQIDSLVR